MDIPVIGKKHINGGKPWSDDEVTYLKIHHKELNASVMAEVLYRTKLSVYRKCHELGLDMKIHMNQDTKGYVLNLFFGEGLSTKEIAELLDIKVRAVQTHLKPYRPTEEQKFKIMQENYNRYLKEEAKNGK